MNKHKNCKRCYTRGSEAWYANSIGRNIDVKIGMYHPDGGTTGEFAVEWIPLYGKLTPQLKCFDDSWDALSRFKDLLKRMAEVDSQDISEPDFCKILDELGILDTTEYEQGVPKNDIRK